MLLLIHNMSAINSNINSFAVLQKYAVKIYKIIIKFVLTAKINFCLKTQHMSLLCMYIQLFHIWIIRNYYN